MYNQLILSNKNTNISSKYSYTTNDQPGDYFLFDIKLFNSKKKFKNFKKIKNIKNGFIIERNDNINFQKYSKIKLDILNITNLSQTHNIEFLYNEKDYIYSDDFIYIEISNKFNKLECFYNLK
jgi:hypothetical protein